MAAKASNPCRLCQQPKPLKFSHLIPEFMYQDMYDEKHRFLGLTSKSGVKDKLAQKGLREYLLCDDCEQQFGRYEKYASGVFYDDNSHHRQHKGDCVILSGLEYVLLKLFACPCSGVWALLLSQV